MTASSSSEVVRKERKRGLPNIIVRVRVKVNFLETCRRKTMPKIPLVPYANQRIQNQPTNSSKILSVKVRGSLSRNFLYKSKSIVQRYVGAVLVE